MELIEWLLKVKRCYWWGLWQWMCYNLKLHSQWHNHGWTYFCKNVVESTWIDKFQCDKLPQSFTQYSRKVPKKGIYLTCYVINFVRHYY
jgi:hypothetical protein